MRFPQPGASCCPAYALRDPRHRCGSSPGRAPAASRAAHQGSQGSHSSKRFKSKNMWKKKITTSEKQELHSLPNRRATCNTFHLKTSCKFSLITGTKSRSRGRAVVSADGGQVFSTKAGRKQRFNTWVQAHSGVTHPGEREEKQGSKPKAKLSTGPWFLTWVDF